MFATIAVFVLLKWFPPTSQLGCFLLARSLLSPTPKVLSYKTFKRMFYIFLVWSIFLFFTFFAVYCNDDDDDDDEDFLLENKHVYSTLAS